MAEAIGVRVISHGEQPARRVLTIEQALQWAYRQELPKARVDGSHNEGRVASAWDRLSRYAEYGTEIDVNPYGVLHDGAAIGAPHPDALKIAAAVDALEGMVLQLPDDWQPFRDMGELGELGEAARIRALDQVSVVADGLRQLKTEPRRLILRFAMLRDVPDWCAERPKICFVAGANGKGKPKWFRLAKKLVEEGGRRVYREVEVDGYDAKGGRPHPDAYRKTFLDPDPTDAATWRAEWQVYVTALELLVIELEGELESIDVRPSGHSLTPWEAPERLGRVLADLRAPALRPVTIARGVWADPETVALQENEPPKKSRKGR